MRPAHRFTLLAGFAAALACGHAFSGCATASTNDDSSSTSGQGGGSSGTAGGGGGGGTAGEGGSGGSTGPCAVDCSQIQAPDCQIAQCNAQTGQCEVVPDEDGTACEDGAFCTVSDSCLGGVCEAGPANDCGITPASCEDVTCDENSQTCGTTAKQNGAACTDPNDLCLESTTCQNGLCIGQPKDCFFSPVPDDCHVSVCNPQNGQCEPEPGNEGQVCVDVNDLCTVNKTCASGVCQGGDPKDCSQLTQGCLMGVCDVNTGQCVQQTVPNGGLCDDLDTCTVGEICTGGTCGGGTPITQCAGGDFCCPSNCTPNNDPDCAQEVWSENFTQGVTVTQQQCNTWVAFRQGLNQGHNSVTWSGTYDPNGITCNNPSAVATIVNGLVNTTDFSVSCNGHTWTFCANRFPPGGAMWLDPPTLCDQSNCPNPGYILRNCFLTSLYGGTNTSTCSPPSQTMTLTFQ